MLGLIKNMKKILFIFTLFMAMSAFAIGAAVSPLASETGQAGSAVSHEQDMAAAPASFLQMEITSTCTEKGALFRIINRGAKWPRNGVLHVYFADDQSSMTKRSMRLASNQKVSFVISNNKSSGRPVGMWIEPQWYKREFVYDAKSDC